MLLDDLLKEFIRNELFILINQDKPTKQALIELIQSVRVEKKFYSLDEVSHITGLTKLALKGRRKRGTVKMINEGNCILIHRDEVNRLIEKLNKLNKF